MRKVVSAILAVMMLLSWQFYWTESMTVRQNHRNSGARFIQWEKEKH